MTPPKTSASEAPPSPAPDAAPLRASGRRERRAVLVGLGVSGLLHILFLLLYPFLMGRLVPVPPPGAPAEPDDLRQGMEIVLLLEVPDVEMPDDPAPDAIEPEAPDPPPDRTDPGVPGVVPDPDEEVVPEVERGLSVAERLRPRMGDPRLWAPLDRELTELTDEERAELLLRGMIQSWNDSVAVAAALSGQALDWTYTDDEGRRWGLSPGRLHLGDFSIPLPFSFDIPPGRRDEMARRQWIIDDIMRGAAAAEIRETWAERAREIRRRMEAERDPG